MKFVTPLPGNFPSDEIKCVQDCTNGTCHDSATNKIWAHNVTLGWLGAQADSAGQLPGPCPMPCQVKTIQELHGHMRAGTFNSGLTINWQALIQEALAALVALLAGLIPPTPATP